MSGRPSVQIYGLGGTIAMSGMEGDAVVPALDAAALTSAVPGLDRIADISAETLEGIGSANLHYGHILDICRRAEAGTAQGVVVTQGTDTLEEAAFLASLLYRGTVPLVFTGAMRPSSSTGADGPRNILDAVATALNAGAPPVSIVMNGTVHDPWRVRKAHTSTVDAFVSDGGPLATVSEGRPDWLALPPARPCPDGARPADLAPVALVPATFNDTAWIIDQLVDAPYAGVVIAAFGAGHVSEVWADRLGVLARTKPVVLASRCGAGRVHEQTYGYTGAEIDLISRGLEPSGRLDGYKSRLLLGYICATIGPQWRSAFRRAVAMDFSGKGPSIRAR